MKALVLSGGGVKGAYQVGVLKYLLGEKIQIMTSSVVYQLVHLTLLDFATVKKHLQSQSNGLKIFGLHKFVVIAQFTNDGFRLANCIRCGNSQYTIHHRCRV